MEARSVPIQFKVNKGDPLMYVRAVAVYCDPDSSNKPVLRCPNHLQPDDPLNSGILQISHKIIAGNYFLTLLQNINTSTTSFAATTALLFTRLIPTACAEAFVFL
jgi:P53 DNA-binding domain